MEHANDNFYVVGENGKKIRLPDNWHTYKRLGWCFFGPIGFKEEGGFEYLDVNV